MKRAALVLAFLFPALVAIVPSHAKEIKIGLITPLSGDVKTYGESVRNSFLIAVEEANAKGGVAGMKITYVIQDDRNDATEAANVANLLVNQHRVKAIVGVGHLQDDDPGLRHHPGGEDPDDLTPRRRIRR